MTAPTVPQNGFASVGDYELRTGVKVPPEMTDTVQTWLNDTSDIIKLYLGDCADEVESAYPDVLTSLTVQRTQRLASQPAGVTSASVGGTSVSYGQNEGASAGLYPSEAELLDRLMDATCCGEENTVPGLGELGVGWGGPPGPDEGHDTLWVVAGRPRPWWR